MRRIVKKLRVKCRSPRNVKRLQRGRIKMALVKKLKDILGLKTWRAWCYQQAMENTHRKINRNMVEQLEFVDEQVMESILGLSREADARRGTVYQHVMESLHPDMIGTIVEGRRILDQLYLVDEQVMENILGLSREADARRRTIYQQAVKSLHPDVIETMVEGRRIQEQLEFFNGLGYNADRNESNFFNGGHQSIIPMKWSHLTVTAVIRKLKEWAKGTRSG